MASYQTFLNEIKARRSVYTLSTESTISNEEIQSILKTALDEAPSTFGSFTTRLVLLIGEENFKFWDVVAETVKAVTPPEQWEGYTKGKIASFRNSYGTVLYLEDPENTRSLEDKYPFVKDKFAQWSEHTSAIHQFIVWTGFANAGLGANLQHYNPLIDDRTKTTFNIPTSWTMIAQMPFGKPSAPAGPKPQAMNKPMEEKLLVRGA